MVTEMQKGYNEIPHTETESMGVACLKQINEIGTTEELKRYLFFYKTKTTHKVEGTNNGEKHPCGCVFVVNMLPLCLISLNA